MAAASEPPRPVRAGGRSAAARPARCHVRVLRSRPDTRGGDLEQLTGSRLDEVVHDLVTGPLGMVDTGFLPTPQRCAATEVQPWTGRSLVRGEVHDENAWALGGVAGHAGLFGTACDVALLAHAVATDGGAALRPGSVEAMLADHGHGNGLGVDLDKPRTMGALASAATAGHTGFTGTSYVLDTRTGAVAVLLTNRVHPTRDGGAVNESRVAVAEALLPVTEAATALRPGRMR
ncbi:MAG: serine hydrolase [Streptosporangiales bacterium]|nr:serine hydrolase [Streptosporangiales bacterium]